MCESYSFKLSLSNIVASNVSPVSQRWVRIAPNFDRLCLYKAVIDAPRVCIRYQVCCSFRNLSVSKAKIRPNFALFDSCKLGERLAKCLRQNEVQSWALKAEFKISDVLLRFKTTIRQRRFVLKIGGNSHFSSL